MAKRERGFQTCIIATSSQRREKAFGCFAFASSKEGGSHAKEIVSGFSRSRSAFFN